MSTCSEVPVKRLEAQGENSQLLETDRWRGHLAKP